MSSQNCSTMIEELHLEEIVAKVKDYALLNGLCYRSANLVQNSNMMHFIPFMLLPTPFPKSQFRKAYNLQSFFNILISQISSNDEFLIKSLKETTAGDPFMKKLFDLYEIAKSYHLEYSSAPEFELFLLRSDYLLDRSLCIKQVEINTISASLAGVSPLMNSLHRYLLSETKQFDLINKLTENKACEGFSKALYSAWKFYNKPNAGLLIVIENYVSNIADQRFLEYSILLKEKSIRILRKNFQEIYENAKLSENNELIIDGLEIAVVYYRTGYNPEDYANENAWNARLLMEKSKSIKCPSLQTQLAGTKKIQQIFSNNLEFFQRDSETINEIKSVFVSQCDLNDETIEKALLHPERYVLKSQREGGGSNFFDDDLKDQLVALKNGTSARTALILMERIDSPIQKNCIVQPSDSNSNCRLDDFVTEFGVYGTLIVRSRTREVLLNETVGHLLRAKNKSATETGVNSGCGALANILLID